MQDSAPRFLKQTAMALALMAVPIYEAIAKQIFKDKPPTPFRIPPGLRLVKFSYEGGTIDQVFKPGTEPGAPANPRRSRSRIL